MRKPKIDNVSIGDRVRYSIDKDIEGIGRVVSVIKAGERPTGRQITEYYEVDLEDKIYNQVSGIIEVDRLVLDKEVGEGYIIIPNTIHLVGDIRKV